MSQISYYTEEGLKKLKDELHEMKTVLRPQISDQIAEARDKGDLSETAESTIDNSKVFILSHVKIKNISNNVVMQYTLVAENEADLKLKKISIDSPIGKGLLGKKVGDIADVTTPNGIVKFEIIEISR